MTGKNDCPIELSTARLRRLSSLRSCNTPCRRHSNLAESKPFKAGNAIRAFDLPEPEADDPKLIRPLC